MEDTDITSFSTQRRMIRWIRNVAVAAAAVVSAGAVLLLLAALFIYQIGYRPLPSETLDIEVGSWTRPEGMEVAGGTLRILSLDLGYGAGELPVDLERGELEPLVPQEVEKRLDRLVELARQQRADVLLLQRVDFGSSFAGKMDQARYLARKLQFGYVVRSHSWKHPYLPFPDPLAGRMVGQVECGLAIVSRIPLTDARRFSLPPDSPGGWWENTFAPNYHAAMADLSASGRHVLLFNTAFTCGEVPYRERQARETANAVARESEGRAVLAASACAPPKALSLAGRERLDYSLDLLRHRRNFQATFSDREALADPERYGTFAVPGQPPVLQDYLLPERGVKVREWKMLDFVPGLSRHRPLLLEIVL